MSPSASVQLEDKFTRGEKCLFTHLVVTFLLVLTLVLVYFVHLCLVRHGAGDAFRFTRRMAAASGEAEQAAAYHVGMVYVGGGGGGSGGRRCVCGSVVVRARWSAAPARCVAARTHPALATLLPSWSARVTDRTGRHIETSIIRSVVHSHFNRDDSLNDIGLFQHKDSIDIENYHYRKVGIDDDFLQTYADRLTVVGGPAPAPTSARGSADGMLWRARASPVSREVCRHHVAPVMELRDHELCVTLDTTPPQALLGVGAALVVDSYVIGFYSWGSERGDLPLVILNMAHYQRWIENIVN